MSTQAVALVKAHTFGSASTKAIMFVVADYADSEWSSFASQKRIAAEAEVGERTVRRTLAELESLGIIRRERRHRPDGTRTSDRLLLVPAAIKALPAALAAGDNSSLPATDDRTTGQPRHSLPATQAEPTGQSLAAHEPSVEPSGEPPEEPRVRRIRVENGKGGMQGGNADLKTIRLGVAYELADQRIAEGYRAKTRDGLARHLAETDAAVASEARRRFEAQTPVASNVRELLDRIGRPMDGETA